MARSSSEAGTVTRKAIMAAASAQDVLHPVEERLVLVLEVGHGQRLLELLEQALLLGVEPGGDDDSQEHVEVAPVLAAELRKALAADAEDRPGLRALRNRNPGLASVEGGHVLVAAQRGLGHADRHLAEEARAVALEEGMLLDADDHVEVAGRPPQAARLALAGDAELASRVDPGRNLDLQLAFDRNLPLAVAGLAFAGHHPARAAAAAAGAGHAEEALLESHLPRPAAGGTGGGLGPRGGAVSPALLAGLGPGDLDVGLGAEGGLLEGDLEVVAQVRPPARAAAAAPEEVAEAEEVAQDVAEVREDRGVEPGPRAHPGVTVGVVTLALLGVAERAVGFRALLEAVFRFLVARVAVGMVLEGQLAIGGLDLLLGGVARDPEHFVVVAFGSHRERTRDGWQGARLRPEHGPADDGGRLLHLDE